MNLCDYGSSSDEDEQIVQPQKSQSLVKQTVEKEKQEKQSSLFGKNVVEKLKVQPTFQAKDAILKAQEIAPVTNTKRKLNYSALTNLRPFKQVKKNEQDDDDDQWESKKQDQSDIDNEERKRKMQNLGVKLFKLSKPKSELKNIGDEIMLKQKNQIASSYEDQVNNQVQNLKHVDQFSKFGNNYNAKKTDRVMDKMKEVLQKELTEKEIENIKKYDEEDTMFIDQRFLHRNDIQQDQELDQQQLQEQKEYEQQQEEQYQQQLEKMQEDQQFFNKRDKKDQKFQNIVDLDQSDLVLDDWRGVREKNATNMELIEKNKIQLPQNKQAKGKNQIGFLAKEVIAQQVVDMGSSIGGPGSQSMAQKRKNRYGW